MELKIPLLNLLFFCAIFLFLLIYTTPFFSTNLPLLRPMLECMLQKLLKQSDYLLYTAENFTVFICF